MNTGWVNGRDVFSANGGRGISFEEVPSELMAGVDVYKNPSAEIIEGGLGGTVNLRTRMPFDEEGRKIAGSADYNYGDHAKKGKPSVSLLFSDRWQTDIGEIGALVNLSYSELATRSDGIQVEPYMRRGVQPENGGDWGMLPDGTWVSPEDLRDIVLGDSGKEAVFVPGGANWRTVDFDRRREGLALAFQWRPNEDTEIYTQYLRSKYRMAWRERSMVFGGASEADNADGKTNTVMPVQGTKFTFDNNGVFLKGDLRSSHYPWAQIYQDSNSGIQFSSGHRFNTQETVTTDWSAGLKHNITDKLTARVDYQYVSSESNPEDFSVFASTLLEGINLDLTGKYPSVTLSDPNFALAQNNYFWRAAMDYKAQNRGNEHAGRADLEYNFDTDSSWLRMFRFGARVADRSYRSMATNYNWLPISEAWRSIPNPDPSRGGVAWLDQFYPGDSELFTMSNFFGGKSNVPNTLWFPTSKMVNIDYAKSTLSELAATGGAGGWVPAQFSPGFSNSQDERTQAGYAILYFENSEALGVPVDGNIGVRVVKTTVSTSGTGRLPDMSLWGDQITDEVKEAFAGQFFSTDARSSYTDVLPSLNVRFRLTDQLQWRIAASKAIARPEFRQMQAWLPLSASVSTVCTEALNQGTRTDPCGFEDLVDLSGSSGNPALRPMRANQYDTALEWYFGPTNLLYTTVFYKDIKDYFANTVGYEDIAGFEWAVTRTNNLDRGKIRGFEVGYNQFFDFLPGWMSGFGVQANYTFVDSTGGRNTIPDPIDVVARTAPVELPLEGLSRRSYNLVGIYEKGPVSLRLAYNWRSRYLLTSSDVITRLPIWNEDFGQLDGSFFYNINANIQVGLQVNNITKTVTELTMGPRLYPTDNYLDETQYSRAWFMNDRRYSAVLRARW